MSSKYNPLAGKKVVVLGGTSGMGFAGAEAALDRGAIVFVSSRSQDKVDAAVAKLQASYPNGSVYGKSANMKDEGSIQFFFDWIASVGEKGVDHVVYSAGDISKPDPTTMSKLEVAASSYDVRLFGAMRVANIIQGLINQGGSLTLTSGSAAFKPPKERPPPGRAVGTSMCGAVVALTKGLAYDLAPIRVNCVAPGLIETEMWDAFPGPVREGFFKNHSDTLLTKSIGKPEDVAQAYLYLMSSSFSTGSTVVVDGGFLLA